MDLYLRKSAYFTLFLLGILLLSACSRSEQRPYLGYIEGQFIHIAPNVPGNIIKRYVYRGDTVKAGEKLFELDPLPESAQLEEAKFLFATEELRLQNLVKGQRRTILDRLSAQLTQGEAELKLAGNDLERYHKLYLTKTISQSEYDKFMTQHETKLHRVAELNANLAEAKQGAREFLILAQKSRVSAAKEKVEQLTWRVSQKTVKAPLDANIFDTFFREGEYVPTGQAVFSLLSPQYIRAVFYVPEQVISQLKIGGNAWFDCDGCQQKQKIMINFISPEAEFTPPIIFSEESRSKLVYRIEAKLPIEIAKKTHPGQPIQVFLTT